MSDERVKATELDIGDLVEVTPEQHPIIPGVYKVYGVSVTFSPKELKMREPFRISLNHVDTGMPLILEGFIGDGVDKPVWKRIKKNDVFR